MRSAGGDCTGGWNLLKVFAVAVWSAEIAVEGTALEGVDDVVWSRTRPRFSDGTS